MSVWLPHLATDRLARAASIPAGGGSFSRPRVTVIGERGSLRLAALSAGAAALGLRPGLMLADARALVPGIDVAIAEPAAEAACLDRLAAWCGRYSPWTASEGTDNLWLDVTGAAHLFGGERRLADELAGRLQALGFSARAAIADSPGAAWGLARFAPAGAGNLVVPPGETRAALDPLPPAALRLGADILATLDRLGLRRIADLHDLPRAGLAQRFGDRVSRRLDQALGRADEPISPRRPVAPYRARLAFAEPIGTAEDCARVAERLLAELCRRLAAQQVGARRLELVFYRVDGTLASAAIGVSRPARDPALLARLFADHLQAIDPGFGIEAATLDASVVEPLVPAQLAFGCAAAAVDWAPLVDRLANRLGRDAALRLVPRDSHVPERAMARIRAVSAPGSVPEIGGTAPAPRPLRLLYPPEPIEAMAPVPDDPPLLFRWRRVLHRVARADGPERIAPEWWRQPAASRGAEENTRDYYRVEDEAGRRFWLYRDGLWRPAASRPRWYLHGVFA
ncbi:MAG: Y-family DNA polymerase [Pseudomonadota bacterium]